FRLLQNSQYLTVAITRYLHVKLPHANRRKFYLNTPLLFGGITLSNPGVIEPQVASRRQPNVAS
ncbi:MAG: hypothetical protein ACYC3N_00005, partial [Halothiobacillus sp.]